VPVDLAVWSRAMVLELGCGWERGRVIIPIRGESMSAGCYAAISSGSLSRGCASVVRGGGVGGEDRADSAVRDVCRGGDLAVEDSDPAGAADGLLVL
jgi:hypothetical protein